MFWNKISGPENLFLSISWLFSKVPEYLSPQICLLCKGELQKDEKRPFATVLTLFELTGKKRTGCGDSWRRPVEWQWWRRLANSLNNCAATLGISRGWHSPPAFPHSWEGRFLILVKFYEYFAPSVNKGLTPLKRCDGAYSGWLLWLQERTPTVRCLPW